MNKLNYKAFLFVLCAIFLALFIGLWSWNTLSELFGGPQAQFKHAVAALGLLLIVKLIFMTRWKRHGRRRNCGRKHVDHDAQQDT